METPCINCGQPITNQFCSNCGQRAGVKRITFREGWVDFWARIYGFDGMFPRTLRDLTIRPGEAARLFIAGNRARYYGPVGYFFLMITVFLLLLDLLGIDTLEFFREMSKNSLAPSVEKGSAEEKSSLVVLQFMSDNMKMIFFLMIPFQALLARYVFFRKSGYNFMENAVLPLYTAGHVYWISIATVIIYKVSGVFLRSSIGTIISTLYFGYAYSNLFNYQPRWKSFIKGIATYYFALVSFMICASIVLFTLIMISPSLRALFKPTP